MKSPHYLPDWRCRPASGFISLPISTWARPMRRRRWRGKSALCAGSMRRRRTRRPFTCWAIFSTSGLSTSTPFRAGFSPPAGQAGRADRCGPAHHHLHRQPRHVDVRLLHRRKWAFRCCGSEVSQRIGDQLFHIGHGDGLGPKDYSYKALKQVFTSGAGAVAFCPAAPQFGHWHGQ